MSIKSVFNSIWVFLFFVSLFGVGSSIPAVARISYLMAVCLALYIFVAFIAERPKIRFDATVLFLFLFFIVVLMSVRDWIGVSNLVFIVICSMAYFSSGALSRIGVPRPSPVVAGLTFIVVLTIWFVFPSFFSNGNYAAAVALIAALPLLAATSGLKRVAVHIALFFALVSMGSRAVLVSFVFSFFFVASISPNLSGFRRFFGAAFLSTSGIGVLIIAASYYQDSFFWDQLLLDYTGKRLESGRIDIWSEALSGFSLSELFWGSGEGGYHITDEGAVLSLHSSYVYLIVRSGIISVFLWVAFVFSRLLKLRDGNHFWSSVAILTFALRDLFETTLIANNLPMAIFFWLYAMGGRLDKR